MRKYCLFLFMFVWCNFSFSQLKDTVFGNVKSVKEEVVFLNKKKQNNKLFEFEGDYGHNGFRSREYTKDRFYSWWYHTFFVHYLNYYKEFNRKNQIIKEIWFDKSEDVVRNYEFSYNDNGELIQEKESSGDENYTVINKAYDFKNKLKSVIMYYTDDPVSFSYQYFNYDDNLRLIEFNSFGEEGVSFGVKYMYNAAGLKKRKLIKDYWITVYKDDGSSSTGKKDYGNEKLDEDYFYDKNNNLVEIHRYKQKDKDESQVELKTKIKRKYNKDNLLSHIITTDEKDTIISIIEIEYDSRGRKTIERNIYRNTVEVRNENFFYNKNKLIDQTSFFSDKEYFISLITSYVYDDKNLVGLIYQDSMEDKKIKCKFEYVFDSKNNWIEQSKYVDGEKLYVWKRSINYWNDK